MKLPELLRKVFFTKRVPKPQKPKIFCNQCFYYIATNGHGEIDVNKVVHVFNGFDVCAYPAFVWERREEDTPISKGSGKVLAKHYKRCSEVNKDNKCVFFKPKESNESGNNDSSDKSKV